MRRLIEPGQRWAQVTNDLRTMGLGHRRGSARLDGQVSGAA
jgi:hypothetical protein